MDTPPRFHNGPLNHHQRHGSPPAVLTRAETSDTIVTSSSSDATDHIEVHGSALPAEILKDKDLFSDGNEPPHGIGAALMACREVAAQHLWFEARISDVVFDSPPAEPGSGGTGDAAFNSDEIARIQLSASVSILVSLTDGDDTTPFEVSLHLARPKLVADSVLLFVPRPGASAEVRLSGKYTAWVACHILGVDDAKGTSTVQLERHHHHPAMGGGPQVFTVQAHQLRKASSSASGARNFTELGGILREVIAIPTDRFATLTPEAFLSIKRRTRLLKITTKHGHPAGGPAVTVVTGIPTSVSRAKVLLSELLRSAKPSKQFVERRQRRLRLLAERRGAYEENRMVEFPVDEAHIGLIIGRQGEKLSRIARDYQVELRVLPDDNGIRLVRAYAMSIDSLNAAQSELEIVYQTVHLSTDVAQAILAERSTQTRDLAQRAGLYSLWVDPAYSCLVLFGTHRCQEAFLSSLGGLLANEHPPPPPPPSARPKDAFPAQHSTLVTTVPAPTRLGLPF